MRSNARKWIFATAIAAGIVVSVFVVRWMIGPRNDSNEFFRALIADIEKRVIPPQGHQISAMESARNEHSITAIWQVESDLGWGDYSEWVGGKLGDGGFKRQVLTETRIIFLKNLPGDTLRITLEKTQEVPLRVQVKFEGFPS